MGGQYVLKGAKKLQLIHELAREEKTQQTLAEEYGVTQARISQFKQENQTAINAIKAQVNDELAGILLASKANRLAEYAQDIEDANEEHTADPEWRRIKANALRQIAEELGQIPNKTSMVVEGKVEYVIEGIDISKL